MPVTLIPSLARHGVWQVSINGTVVVCFSGPLAWERARRRVHELAALLGEPAVELDLEEASSAALFTTGR